MNDLKATKAELVEAFFSDNPGEFLDRLLQFNRLMVKYKSAIREVSTKLEILNDELSLQNKNNPIESMKSRIKKPLSIAEKLRRQGNEVTIDAIAENLNDVAGIRVICPFVNDIYKVADMLIKQDDVILVQAKDYIKNPKPNGYRSYHMIIEIPVFFSEHSENMRVEIQIRTVAMDFWASLEHQIQYKNGDTELDSIVGDLKRCAETIAATDLEMQRLHLCIHQKNEQRDDKMEAGYDS